jgi:uncharacterized membrane protein YtjA (UPF0391 family)
MLRWIGALMAFAAISAVLGFGGVLAVSAGMAQTLCGIYLGLLAVTLVFGIIRGV